jgi:ankyrin repeat protein
MSLQEELTLRRSKMLLVACGRKDITLVKDLVENHKVDVNYRNVHGETPLYAACEGGALNVVQYLLTKGASVEKSKTNSDQLLIHAAAASGDVELLTLLTAKKQSLSAAAYDGTTPLHVAIR